MESTVKTGEPDFSFIHLRLQQRTGKKKLTIIEGLDPKFDLQALLKHFKKLFNTGGTVITDEAVGEVIQISGDHRSGIAKFLIKEGISTKNQIKIHGN